MASDAHPWLLHRLRQLPNATAPTGPLAREPWSAIVEDAQRHGLTALVSDGILQAGCDDLPPDIRDALARATHALVAKNLALAHELAAILSRFRDRGIQAVPLRGPALAEQLYGDPTARPCGDLDLLVRKAQLDQVKAVLSELDYRLCDRRPGFAQAFSYTWEFFKTQPIPIIIEPHWSLAYPPYTEQLDMDAVWRRCVPGRACGVETWLLSPEDQLLNLCLHLVHHNGNAPRLWVSELDAILRKEQTALQWPQLLKTAQEAGVGRLVAQALHRTQAAFETPLPEGIVEQCRAQHTLRRSMAGRVLDAVDVPGKESLAAWFALKGWAAKWHYAGGLLFPSPEFMRLHYGLSTRWQVGLWYLRRVFQLGLSACKGFCQLVVNGYGRRRYTSFRC